MNRTVPPLWLERSLLLLLPAAACETIAGDLQEAFVDRAACHGRLGANLWYARQVLSFLPRPLFTVLGQPHLLAVSCVFTMVAAAWLGFMDLLLRHPGYLTRELIAGTIMTQASLTLFVACLRRSPRLRPLVFAGCVAILYLASKAFYGVLQTPHFEGYIVLIALALVVQALLTVITLLRPAPLGRPRPGNL